MDNNCNRPVSLLHTSSGEQCRKSCHGNRWNGCRFIKWSNHCNCCIVSCCWWATVYQATREFKLHNVPRYIQTKQFFWMDFALMWMPHMKLKIVKSIKLCNAQLLYICLSCCLVIGDQLISHSTLVPVVKWTKTNTDKLVYFWFIFSSKLFSQNQHSTRTKPPNHFTLNGGGSHFQLIYWSRTLKYHIASTVVWYSPGTLFWQRLNLFLRLTRELQLPIWNLWLDSAGFKPVTSQTWSDCSLWIPSFCVSSWYLYLDGNSERR